MCQCAGVLGGNRAAKFAEDVRGLRRRLTAARGSKGGHAEGVEVADGVATLGECKEAIEPPGSSEEAAVCRAQGEIVRNGRKDLRRVRSTCLNMQVSIRRLGDSLYKESQA
jgi:hypothetical protein